MDINENDIITIVLKVVKSEDKNLKNKLSNFYNQKKNKALSELFQKILTKAMLKVTNQMYLRIFDECYKDLDDF